MTASGSDACRTGYSRWQNDSSSPKTAFGSISLISCIIRRGSFPVLERTAVRLRSTQLTYSLIEQLIHQQFSGSYLQMQDRGQIRTHGSKEASRNLSTRGAYCTPTTATITTTTQILLLIVFGTRRSGTKQSDTHVLQAVKVLASAMKLKAGEILHRLILGHRGGVRNRSDARFCRKLFFRSNAAAEALHTPASCQLERSDAATELHVRCPTHSQLEQLNLSRTTPTPGLWNTYMANTLNHKRPHSRRLLAAWRTKSCWRGQHHTIIIPVPLCVCSRMSIMMILFWLRCQIITVFVWVRR